MDGVREDLPSVLLVKYYTVEEHVDRVDHKLDDHYAGELTKLQNNDATEEHRGQPEEADGARQLRIDDAERRNDEAERRTDGAERMNGDHDVNNGSEARVRERTSQQHEQQIQMRHFIALEANNLHACAYTKYAY